MPRQIGGGGQVSNGFVRSVSLPSVGFYSGGMWEKTLHTDSVRNLTQAGKATVELGFSRRITTKDTKDTNVLGGEPSGDFVRGVRLQADRDQVRLESFRKFTLNRRARRARRAFERPSSAVSAISAVDVISSHAGHNQASDMMSKLSRSA